MRLADFVVDYLHGHGMNAAYMVNGTGSIYLDDAFISHGNVQCIVARHESAAALMATGSAKISGKLGVVVVTEVRKSACSV